MTPPEASEATRREGAQHVLVAPDEAGRRLDNFLRARLPDVPKSHVYRVIRTGAVRVNGRRARPEARLESGDDVRIPPLTLTNREDVPVPSRVESLLQDAVLYEDDHVLVLNKPAGLPVHAGSGYPYGVIEALRSGRPDGGGLELVHRLDRETSGCLLVAKDQVTLRELNRAVAGTGIGKVYVCLVRGAWRGAGRAVRQPLSRGAPGTGPRRVTVDRGGRSAVTHFRPLEKLASTTLLEAELETGRTHQIRVHAAHVGHPLAGDDAYGDRPFNRELRTLGLRRMFLHASRLTVPLPGGENAITVAAPLPADLDKVLARLRLTQ